jgi:hypothetical protein
VVGPQEFDECQSLEEVEEVVVDFACDGCHLTDIRADAKPCLTNKVPNGTVT